MKNVNNSKLRIIPLGGLEQIGMNITAFEFEDSIVVVDCGLAFPEDDMLGIDLVIPDVSYLEQNLSKVKGFVITHGHEDHIGALPYVLKKINVPVYSTKLTIALIEGKLKEHNMLKTTKRKVVKHGQSINLGQFRVEFIKTNHSIADASALAIYSPAGTVVHTFQQVEAHLVWHPLSAERHLVAVLEQSTLHDILACVYICLRQIYASSASERSAPPG